jgi:hypothetical protein
MTAKLRVNEMYFKLPCRIDRCLCCGSQTHPKIEYGILSPFFCKRVLQAPIPLTANVLLCKNCGSKFFDVNVSSEQLGKLYDGYRGESYFRQRNNYEPWYSRQINCSLGSDKEFSLRRVVLIDALSKALIKNEFESVLDHGGDRGQMLKCKTINAIRKCVFEVSGVQSEDGVESVTYEQLHSVFWNLILSCHVLEHLPNPKQYLLDLVGLGKSGTVYFFEVPNEVWASSSINKLPIQLNWINWLRGHLFLTKWIHFLSVVFKAKFKFIPPFLFPVLNEHLNFFTLTGLSCLLNSSGLVVKSCFIADSGHIVAVAVKE